MNRAVILDRDGTVIEHIPYLTDPDKVEIVAGGAEALASLKENGYLLVVVSNQSLVGRGYGTVEDIEAVNARMLELFDACGVILDAVKYCPHRPEDNCPNRKPNPGMLLDAAKGLDIDIAQSVMVGDNMTDVQAGQNAGCPLNILIDHDGTADYSPAVPGLAEAAELILGADG